MATSFFQLFRPKILKSSKTFSHMLHPILQLILPARPSDLSRRELTFTTSTATILVQATYICDSNLSLKRTDQEPRYCWPATYMVRSALMIKSPAIPENFQRLFQGKIYPPHKVIKSYLEFLFHPMGKCIQMGPVHPERREREGRRD